MLRVAAQRLEAQELIALAGAALIALLPVPALGQTPPAVTVVGDPAWRARAEALIPVLAGKPGYATLFATCYGLIRSGWKIKN